MKYIHPHEKLLLLLGILSLLVSCGHRDYDHRLVAADSLMESKPDSAYALLVKIDTAELSTDADRAYYGLLYTQARYKTDKPAKSETLTQSIHYYKQHDNPKLLQRCYYYRGMVNHDNGCPDQKTMEDLKRSENMISVSGDTLLTFRIYDAITVANINNAVPKQSLEYARKELSAAYLTHDESRVSSGLNNIAISLLLNNDIDSAMIYMDKLQNMISHLPRDLKAETYNNMAYLYAQPQIQDNKKVEYCLKQALENDTLASTVLQLAELYLREGRNAEAIKLLKGMSHTGNVENEVLAYESLSKYYQSEGNLADALTFHQRRDSLYDIIDTKMESDNLIELQMRYDNEVIKNKQRADQSRFLLIILSVVSFCSLLFVGMTWILRNKNRRIRHFENQLRTTEELIDQLKSSSSKTIEERSQELNGIISSKQNQIDKLRVKLTSVSDETASYSSALQSIRRGLSILLSIMQDENVSQLDKKEREDFIACYRILDTDFLEGLENLKDNKLSVQEVLFCILYRLHKDSAKIKKILSMSDDAYRKTKSRVLKKLYSDISMKAFCDKIRQIG